MFASDLNSTTSTYSVAFEGLTIETIVTNKAIVVEEWVELVSSKYIGKHTMVGLDTERMLYEVKSKMKATILQLCIENKCLILQFFYMDSFPHILRSFLVDSNFTFVGVEVGLDILKLKKEYELECTNGVVVLKVVKKHWPERFQFTGLKYLAKELVGLNMMKPYKVCKSNWTRRVLSKNQVEYACIDAYASYKIGHKLLIEKDENCFNY